MYAAARSSQVAKKKNSMALFEVISKTRDKNPDSEVSVPNWIKPSSGQEDQEPEVQVPAVEAQDALDTLEPETQTPEPRQEEEEVATPKPETLISPTLQTTSTWEPRRSPEPPKSSDLPIWSTSGGRLILSLNYVTCLVASMGVLLLIIGAFVIGRMTASDSTPIAAGGGRRQAVVKREVGKFYMVIETLKGRSPEARTEADRIVKFCNANGEPSQVQLLGQNLIVWSLTPFDAKNSEEVTAHALHVQNELGAKYTRQYGSKYKFSQPKKNGKLVPVLYPYTKPKPRP
jgi:hypothetical protein